MKIRSKKRSELPPQGWRDPAPAEDPLGALERAAQDPWVTKTGYIILHWLELQGEPNQHHVWRTINQTELAKELHVNRVTVAANFRLLRDAGYAEHLGKFEWRLRQPGTASEAALADAGDLPGSGVR